MNTITNRLMPWVIGACSKEDDSDEEMQHTILKWSIEAAKGTYWTPLNLVRAINGLWFASSHQVWMTIVNNLHELCSNPEYIPILRDEISSQSELTFETIERMPLLDSFMKEVSRMKAFDAVAVRRKALKSFTFSDGGPHVPAGNVVCVPQTPILLDPKNYSDPLRFNGFRFAPPEAVAAISSHVRVDERHQAERFTDVTENYPPRTILCFLRDEVGIDTYHDQISFQDGDSAGPEDVVVEDFPCSV
ncbi:MAG: hypothetical protein Q9214_001066 [Letrouitia sp. 1 TL-2023]